MREGEEWREYLKGFGLGSWKAASWKQITLKRAMECEHARATSSVKGRRASLAGQSASKEVGDLPLVLFLFLTSLKLK